MIPLVSCIMPTHNRRAFIGAAVDCWQKQDYERKELVIIDDGEQKIIDLLPLENPSVHYIRSTRVTTGMKRNRCIEEAKGEIICQFDDDDWSRPDRISKQVRLLQSSGKPVTGYGEMLYWDVYSEKAMHYRTQVPGYVVGLSLCYLRSWWERSHFPDKMRASDNDLIYKNLHNIAMELGVGTIVARAHGENVGGTKCFPVVPASKIPQAFWDNEKLRLSGGFQ